MRHPYLHIDPSRHPPEVPNTPPEGPDISPSQPPQPEIPEPPPDPIVPEPGHAPEIQPDQTPTEIPSPGAQAGSPL